MNKVFNQVLKDNTPVINKKITDGTAKGVLAEIPEYLDSFLRSSIASLDPRINLKYVSYRYIGPKEEYNDIILKREGTVPYDLGHNNVYVIELRFDYNGQVITRPIYLPYATRGNLMVMGGAQYHIKPVLTDTIITPAPTGVFFRLLKAKLNFTSRSRYFVVDDEKVVGSMIHGEILRPNTKQITDMIGRPLPATALYLLGKYGLKGSLINYGGVDDVVISNDPNFQFQDDYTVYSSSRNKPRGLKAVPYIPHDLRIGVMGDNINKPFVTNFMCGVIYSMDILPELATDLYSLVSTDNIKEEIAFWRIVLGKIIYKNSFSISRIVQDMDSHFNALEGYIDPTISDKLYEAGIATKDFFGLLAILIEKYDSWTMSSNAYNSNIENRYIDILYYLTYDLIIGFNRAILSLNKRITKTTEIGYKEVSKILRNELGSKKIFGLTKSTEPNLAIASVDSTSDLLYSKITSVLEDQSRGNGVKRSNKSTLPESARTLKGGDLGFGSMVFLSKGLPSPRFKLNLFVDYDLASGKVKYPEDIQRSLTKLNYMLQGMSPNTKILESELESGDVDNKDI